MTKTRATRDQQATAKAPQSWGRLLYPAGVGVAALGLFIMTLAPTVTAEDSGELIAAAWHFGIPHPPGYPLWTLLCGIFIHVLPFGEIAWRANLFSAVCSAGAAVFAYAAIRQLGLARSAAAAAALVWIWTEWSWSQSVITEVYGLNSLLTAAVLYFVLRWHRTGTNRPLVVVSLLLGLGMAHHQVIAFVGLAVLVWVLLLRPSLVKRWRLVLLCPAAFVIGLLPYAYLPIRASAKPVMNWDDPSTLQRTWAHATRQAYGTLGPTPSSEPRSAGRLAAQLTYLGGALCDDLTPWLAGAAALGLLLLARRNRRVLLLVLLWLVCTGGLFVLVANFDLDRTNRWLMRVFFIPVSLGLVIPLAYLLDALRGMVYRSLPSHRRLAVLIVALLVVAGPTLQAASHQDRCDYSNYWYAYDHAQNLLTCMMPDALVFPYADYNTFPLVYLLMVQQRRPDVLIAAYSGRVRPELHQDRPPDSPDSIVTWLIKHAGRPAYCTIERPSPVPSAAFVPAGIMYYLKPPRVTFDGSDLVEKCSYRNLEQPSVQDLSAALIMIQYHLSKGSYEFKRGERETGLEHLRTAAQLGHGMKGVMHKIGVLMFNQGLQDEAITYCEEAARLDPHWVVPRWSLFRAYKIQSRWEQARGELSQIIEADPRDSRACAELGFLLHRHLNDSPGAVRSWREALRRNPALSQVKRILDRYDREGRLPEKG